MKTKYYLSFTFFILFLLITEVKGIAHQKEELVDVSVLSKDLDVIVSKGGLVLDPNGIIVTSSMVIEKWLEDVQNILTVKIKDRSYQLSKLVYFSKKKGIAIFSINDVEAKKDIIQQTIKKGDSIKRILIKDTIVTEPSNIKDKRKKETIYTSSKRDSSDFLKEALRLYKEGKYLDAIELYKRLSRQNPNPEIYNRLGILYLLTENYSEAIDTLEKAINIDPQDSETYFNLGIAYFLKGDREGVFEYYLILNRINKEKAEELFEFVYR